MYKHILLPTDGSEVAEQAATAGIALALAVGARVTALHVLPPDRTPALEAWAHARDDFERRLDDTLLKLGNGYLENIREAARYAGVACECSVARGASVHDAILEAAREHECDLVVMGTHARDDPQALLGSETVMALARSNVPLLVHPPRHRAQAAANDADA